MKHLLKTAGLELAVATFCAWQASDLLAAWRHSPFDRWGWLSFLIWSAPVVLGIINPARSVGGSTLFTVFALITSLGGRLLNLNAVLYFALAFSLAGFVPSGARRIVWLVGALAWMPAFGWLAHDFPIYLVAALRLLFATATVCPLLLVERRTLRGT
jgi:hypothetical protein